MADYTYIATQEGLKQACKIWSEEDTLAIDLECENNLHHYGTFISLIQLSTLRGHWIIDVLTLETIEPLKKIFENPNIQKLFHDVSFDLRILNFQFQCKPKNVFDTQIAATFLNKKDIGLKHLLEEYFQIKKEKKYQMADWTKRPLSPDMLLYALHDTAHLIHLRNILRKQLRASHKYEWFCEEMAHIESLEMEHKESSYQDIKGYVFLSDTQRSILKVLFELREKCAQKVNMPNYFVMNNKKLLELVEHSPRTLGGWEKLQGVHPVVRSRAKSFFLAVEKAKQLKISLLPNNNKRFTPDQRRALAKLHQTREYIANKVDLQKHLVMSKEQMQQIIISNSLEALRDWQQKLVKKYDSHIV
ncbi:ribonuclease D [Candidatus Woesearchaeota archaeon]|nr:ribonuclease D [Candidatus Woesearchaeota archaeon]